MTKKKITKPKETKKVKESAPVVKDHKTRNYLLTFNNPKKYKLNSDIIYSECVALEPVYFCMSEEIGSRERTPHIHVFIKFKNPRYFSSVKKTFPKCHIDNCVGTDYQCVDYVFKVGKWELSEKSETNIRESHREWGERPVKTDSAETVTSKVKKLLDSGVDVEDAVDAYPSFAFRTRQLEDYVDKKKAKKFKYFKTHDRPFIKVYYIFGKTRAGKSYYVRHKHSDICVASDYSQPFEDYDYNEVMVFEEFRGDIPLKKMLRYLEQYACSLPHRYNNKFACYTIVYVISNIPIDRQFLEEKDYEPESWDAFVARFDAIMHFKGRDPKERLVYKGYQDYLANKFITLDEFEKEEAEKYEQTQLV